MLRLALTALFITNALAFYLPGLAPKNYKRDDVLNVFANSVKSQITELPYDFYDKNFGFPRPAKIESENENLGSALSGDRLVKTEFKVAALFCLAFYNFLCSSLC